ncbi:anti-sigma factor [Desulfuromonas versatilis]|uniref:Anti-sigma factor n=1 Tax=Desulfuromonas versatilis TaxID=2802975 RepID=A0ABN6DZD2_9BACT|nr:ATP-binding protein [Desulfuromonas versatilis]BCR05412.1 anti-sigma factor [Desulfuromonas versatilis]
MNEKIEVDIRVPNQTRYLGLIGKIGEDIARTLRRYKGDREELAYHLNLVLTEAMTNAIRHANEDDPKKEVHIVISIQDENLNIKVFDQGQGFDVCAISTPDFKGLDEHGRGVFIIRTLMDEVTYRKLDGGNVLEMIKALR